MSNNYQPYANRLNFAGGGMPSTLDHVDAGSYDMISKIIKANPGARLASFYGLRLYDTARVTAGTAFNSSEFELFATPVGQQTTEMNGTTSYVKSKIDTNMSVSRQLPASQEAWITSIQVRVLISGSLDDSTQTGANLGLANNPGTGPNVVAADDILATNLAQAALEGIYLRFSYNQTTFEEGPLCLFPSRYGVSGYAGGVLTATKSDSAASIVQNETAVNNGFGFVYRLPVYRHIESLYQFNVTLQALNTFTPTRNFRIQTILEGLGAKGVTG